MDFLSELNPEQRKAAAHIKGPILVIAGAGSGKTRVLTYRIAHLIKDHRVVPHQILAVTFTNKAAQEMRERLEGLIGPMAKNVWLSTFHSACLRILRRYADHLGYTNGFVVYDDSDQLTLIKNILKEMHMSDRAFKPRAVKGIIDTAKNDQMSPEVFMSGPLDFFQERVAQIYVQYQKMLMQNNAMDFNDLINQTVRLFETKPEIAKIYQNSLKYLLVDEYQDTNPAQYRLLSLLTDRQNCKSPNLFVVGDEDQSIYGWRGADIRIILKFEGDFEEAQVYRLEQNYRSTQVILDSANHLIAYNQQRKGKTLWTERKGGDKILYATIMDEHAEGALVAQKIRDFQGEGKIENYSNVAVFYRTNAQSRVLEEELRRAQIPYKIIGGTRFYDRLEIKDVLAYLRVLANPKDNISLMRIMNRPARGLGKTTVDRLVLFSETFDCSVLEALGRIGECEDIAKGAQKKLAQFGQMMREMRDLSEHMAVSELARKVLEVTGYQKSLEAERTIEAETRLENIFELLAGMQEFEDHFQADEERPQPTLGGYLDQVTLVQGTDEVDMSQGVVSLMTIHLAKGLEFPVVFITGLEEGLFPHSRSLSSEDDLEEERRICYVGLTRAKNILVLTNTYRRRIYGAEQYNVPSRFCEEIPGDFIERIGYADMEESSSVTSFSPKSNEETIDYSDSQIDYDEEFMEDDRLQVGMHVRHAQFGVGVIRKTEGQRERTKVIVQFPGVGQKKLLLRLANLEVVR